ncbi:hypothetical protein Nepgr_000697 [Nepenthes gracilis]|uniref:Helicase protein MOM1-like n=1 Tax=Nepenthes gracilis TaxID=150966 RepID=A0AAD3P3V3_NEPGR|nr:hypothetical protein Nepgr_000697 [Nepenthes gracilis]
MVKRTHSGRKLKDDEASSLMEKLSNGLRRSTRETSSRKQANFSPSNMRKSERLEKQIPTKLHVRKKPEGAEKGTPNPLRRSERANKFQTPNSSSLKKLQKSSNPTYLKNRSGKNERSIKELAQEAKVVKEEGKQDSKMGWKRQKRLDARSYRAMINTARAKAKVSDYARQGMAAKYPMSNSCNTGCNDHEKVHIGEKEGFDVNVEEMRNDSVGRAGDVNVESSKSILEKEDGEIQGHLNNGESVLVDSSMTRKLQEDVFPPALLQKSDVSIQKENNVHVASVESETVANRDICCYTADVIRSSSSGSIMNCSPKDCAPSFKRKSLDDNLAIRELNSCNKEDRGDCEVGNTMDLTDKCDCKIQQKDSPSDAQMCSEQNTCVTCKLPGNLMRCDGNGCKRSYHASCLDPPLWDVLPGVWHCPWCVKKKMQSGVYSVSEGVESICDVRQVEVSYAEGVQSQKEYFVKYKGLAHVHNQWIPESQLLFEVPHLVLKFDQKKEVTQCKPEWAVPHHLLQKRLIKTPMDYDEYICQDDAHIINCHCEWLVKWCGLDYNHVTWELEDASFFKTPEGQRVIKVYEMCQNKGQEINRGSYKKLSKLPAGCLPGADNSYLHYVNKLRDYWHRGHNVISIDEQDRLAKIVYFMLSLESNISRPSLIISLDAMLSSWEAEFLRLAPSLNVVSYIGSRDTRERIRKLEFQKGGCMTFQILLSTPETILEDVEALKCIGWEAVVVDHCQNSDIVVHSDYIKKLSVNWRLLLTNIHVKDSVADYLNILSLLNFGDNSDISDGPKADGNHNISMLMERLSPFVVNSKAEPSRFIEFWVPVQISDVQLEQYCASLLSKSTALLSCSRNDIVGALREILLSTRKCCNHPYIMNPSLQLALTKDRPVGDLLDIGVKASGKLQLLDVILSVLKNRGLRVLILFQSIRGSGKDSIGDILEDYLHQRFGQDSYERIDGGGYRPSKKQAALNKFNNEKGRFVFLLETRACLPSIKLSSVDVVIIFDSDWNPLNDLRALQKITIDSKFEPIKVFRLYCFCTIEEKILVLAKKEITLDSTLQCISSSISQMLLMWGASYLFSKLDEFHHDNTPDGSSSVISEDSLSKDVLQEFVSVIEKHENVVSSKFISRAQQSGGSYLKNTSLLGEQKVQPQVKELPQVFWARLLDGRHPRWKYLSVSSQRNRKRVQYFENSLGKPDVQTDETVKKRKKLGGNNFDLKVGTEVGRRAVVGKEIKASSGTMSDNDSESTPKSVAHMSPISHKNDPANFPIVANDTSAVPEVQMVEAEDKQKLLDAQRQLHHLLKPEISKLCKILQFTDDVKKLAEHFLEYVINNHRVSREPETVLQSFLISVCWTAASLLGQKIDHKESLLLAREHLKFNCMEDEADLIFSKMRLLKKAFLLQSEDLRPKDQSSVTAGFLRKMLNANGIESAVSALQNVAGNVQKGSLHPECSDKQACTSMPTVEMAEREILKNYKKIQKKCKKRMEKLKQKQIEEVLEFHKIWEEKKARLEKEQRLESAVICSIHSNIPVRIGKLKNLDNDYAKKLQDLEHEMTMRLKGLETTQEEEKMEEQEKTARWLEEVKSWAQVELLDKLLLLERGNRVGQSHAIEQSGMPNGSNDASSVSGDLLGRQMSDRVASMVHGHVVEVSRTPEVTKGKVNISALVIGASMPDNQSVSGHNDTTVELPSEVQISDGSLTGSPPGSGLSHTPATDTLHRPLADEAMSGRQLEELPVEMPEAVPEEAIGGSDLNEMLNSTLETETVANQTDVQPYLINSSMTQPDPYPAEVGPLPVIQGNAMESCQPLNEIQDLEELVIEMHDNFTEGEASASHDQGVLHDEAGNILPTTVPESTLPTFSHNQQSLPSTSRPVDQLSEGHTYHQSALTSMPPDQSPANLLHLSSLCLLDSATNPSFANSARSDALLPATRAFPALSESNNHPMQVSSPAFSRLAPPLFSDPLQNELERICREREQALKIHDEMMIRLESDCEKEIEEMVAQIHRKYATKRQEAEASFLGMKKELDSNQNKVLMNKILAEAFRYKCIDYRAASGIPQAMNSSYTQQLLQLQQPAAGPSSAAAAAVHAGPALVGTQSAASAARVVHNSLTSLSGIPSRPLQISSVTPTAGNQQQVISQVCAPPPHLQPFRPLMPMPSGSVSSSIPCVSCQQPTSNVLPEQSPSAAAVQLRSRRRTLTYNSGSHGGPYQAESLRRLSALNDSSLSAYELLRDITIRSGASQMSDLPSLQDQWASSQSESLGNNICPSSSQSAAVPDVICLVGDD